MAQMTLPAKVDRLDSLMDFLVAVVYSEGMDTSKWNHISLAVEEIFVNIASYAYPDGSGDVTVLVRTDAEQIVIEFRDSGEPFDPLSKTPPDFSPPAYAREIGGLGIHMIKKLMDGISYEHHDGQNILTIIKNI